MKHGRIIGILCAAAMLLSSAWIPQSTGNETTVTVRADEPEVKTYQGFSYVLNPYTEAIEIVGYTGTSKSVTIPNTIEAKPVTIIDANAFTGNEEIESLTIPSNIRTIEDGAFRGCTSLHQFYCTANKWYSFTNGVLYYDCGKMTMSSSDYSSTITLTKIALFCAKDSAYITVPEGVDGISAYAFANRKKMTHIVLPAGIQYIGKCAFYGCTKLRGMAMTSGSETSSEFNIPYGTIAIDNKAFFGCESIRTVSFPSTLEYIGANCFVNCPELMSAYIPDSVKKIGDAAFGYAGTEWENGNLTLLGNSSFTVIGDSETNEDGEKNGGKEYADSNYMHHTSPSGYQGGGLNDDGEYTITDVYGNEIPIRMNCTHNPDNDFDHCYVYSACVPVTCTAPGALSGICYCGHTFYQEFPAAGHCFGYPQYQWSADHTVCTAVVTCIRDSSHVITEQGTVTKRELGGKTVYTAAFKNPIFGKDSVTEDGNTLPPDGDADDDGTLGVTDVVQLQRNLMQQGELINWRAADLNQDGEIDAFDLALMKRALISQK